MQFVSALLVSISCASLAMGAKAENITNAQKISEGLQSHHQSVQELLDIETRIIQLSHHIAISAHSASEPKADRASIHDFDVNFAVHVEDEIRLKEAIDMIEKANKSCGLPPIIVKTIETAKPASIAGAAYKTWLLQNAPEASTKLRTILIQHGLVEDRSALWATRISKFAQRTSTRAATAFVIGVSLTLATLELTDKEDPQWCMYLADTTGNVKWMATDHSFTKWYLAPIGFGLVLVLFILLAVRKGLLRSEEPPKPKIAESKHPNGDNDG